MSKCWYCNNELTSEDNSKHFGICNKCYDEMFKSGDIIIRSFTNKIAELQEQLAEKEQEIESLKESSDKNIDYLIEFASLIENEKDCNRMLKAIDRVKKGNKYIIDKQHQDKISFAVERLEKVRENIKKVPITDFDLSGNFEKMYKQDAIRQIDNQINGLKGEK